MFIWREEFELGIPSIDNQHKYLIELGNKVNALLNTHLEGDNDSYEINEVMKELRNYTQYHFKTEEDLFLKYNYPDYQAHKKEHDAFIDYLDSIDLEAIQNDQSNFLRELLEEIVHWVFNHIITTDYMYKDFLIDLGSK